MRTLRALCLALTVVIAFVVGVPAPGRAAAVFTLTNAASYDPGDVPRESLLTLFVPTRISGESNRGYEPWVQTTPDGLSVEATCGADGTMMTLPILYVGFSGTGSQVNIYYPGVHGDPRFGTCAAAGTSTVVVHPAPGYGGGTPIVQQVVTVSAHPGVFSVGDTPAGEYVGTGTGVPLSTCAAQPAQCPAAGGELRLYLTGAEPFSCAPCSGQTIALDLAPVVDGVVGPYVPQTLVALERVSAGVQRATVRLTDGTGPGRYRLRIRSAAARPNLQQLQILLG